MMMRYVKGHCFGLTARNFTVLIHSHQHRLHIQQEAFLSKKKL